MCIVCIANNINRNVYMYLNTRNFPTTGYARVLLFMFIRRELGGTGTGSLLQFTYCVVVSMLFLTAADDNFATPFPFFDKNKVWFYMRIVKRQNLQSSSSANYR